METVKIFISYVRRSEQDYRCLINLKKHLSPLEHLGYINVWYGKRSGRIDDEEHEILVHLWDADLILVLLSPDYIASEYCYLYELGCILDKQEAQTACVIPIIARTCEWKSNESLEALQPLPRGGRPIATSSNVAKRDDILHSVVNDIAQIVNQLLDGEICLALSELLPLGDQRFEDSLVQTWLAKDMVPHKERQIYSDRSQGASLFLPAPTNKPALIPKANKNEFISTSSKNKTSSKTAKRSNSGNKNKQLSEEATISWIKPLPRRRKNFKPKSIREYVFTWVENAKLEYHACFSTKLVWLAILLSVFDLGFFFFIIANWLKLSQSVIIISIFLLLLGILNTDNLLAMLLAVSYGIFWGRIFQIQFAWPAIKIFVLGVCIFLFHFLLFRNHPRLYSQRFKNKWWILW